MSRRLRRIMTVLTVFAALSFCEWPMAKGSPSPGDASGTPGASGIPILFWHPSLRPFPFSFLPWIPQPPLPPQPEPPTKPVEHIPVDPNSVDHLPLGTTG